MKFIRTKLHGYLDYIYGIFLAISPWVFGFAVFPLAEPEIMIPLLLGAGTIVYSLLTDYELGVYDLISVKGHLALDMILGLFLATSPWLFGFESKVWLLHVLFGAIAVLVALFTTTKRSPKQTRREHHAAIARHA